MPTWNPKNSKKKVGSLGKRPLEIHVIFGDLESFMQTCVVRITAWRGPFEEFDKALPAAAPAEARPSQNLHLARQSIYQDLIWALVGCQCCHNS